jgi:uncharacterized protein
LIYHAPGVYVEERSSGSRTISAAGTSCAGFVGGCPNSKAHLHEAIPIQNWTEFVSIFVGDGDKSTPLANAVYGFLSNGGPRCYVVNIGEIDEPLVGDGRGGRKGLEVLEPIDEVAIVAAPGCTDAMSYEAVTRHCEKLQNRVGILDAPMKFTVDQLTKVATPPITGSAPSAEPQGLGACRSQNGYAAIYAPHIRAADCLSPKQIVSMAPSGHIAGVYARTDATRGVHKAPANESVYRALDLEYNFTRDEQALLNVNGVNCIRFFPDRGITVFGAKTTADESSEWKYVPVRRLFTMVENSILRSTRWVVFEPNDYALWKAITRDISAFLRILWRDGALLGRTPEQAFYVKCDDETNPPEVIDAGMVVTEIGMAPVKPAEFVVFRIGQDQGGAQTTEGGRNG